MLQPPGWPGKYLRSLRNSEKVNITDRCLCFHLQSFVIHSKELTLCLWLFDHWRSFEWLVVPGRSVVFSSQSCTRGDQTTLIYTFSIDSPWWQSFALLILRCVFFVVIRSTRFLTESNHDVTSYCITNRTIILNQVLVRNKYDLKNIAFGTTWEETTNSPMRLPSAILIKKHFVRTHIQIHFYPAIPRNLCSLEFLVNAW